MATITSRNGKLLMQWRMPNGRRHWAGLGNMQRKSAQSLCVRLDEVLAELKHAGKISPGSVAWLQSLGRQVRDRMVECGLVAHELTVAGLCDEFEGRADRKQQTNVAYGHTIRNLKACYGANTGVSSVVGEKFRDFLNAEGLSSATVNRRIGIARSIFRPVKPNPFEGVRAGGQRNPSRQKYIDYQTINLVMEYADPELRLALACARFGGLRVPSELTGLRWSDVRWDQQKVYVRSPKTEHHVNGASREVPLFNRLREELLFAWDSANEHEPMVFPSQAEVTNSALRTRLMKLLRKVGIKPWPRIWQNLRASWATDAASIDPANEAKWGGHSEKISEAHYTMTTDDSFRRAAQPNAHPALGSSRPQESRKTTTDCVSQVVSTTTGSILVGAVGRETPSKISRKQRRAAVGATMQCRQRLLLRAYTRSGATR